MSKYNHNSLQKLAILEAYGRKCFYCGEPLIWSAMHIDHIIPEKLVADYKELEKIKTEFGLPEGFQINSFDNLVPAHGHCNQKKGGVVYDKTKTMFFLGEAQKHVSSINENLTRIIASNKSQNAIVKLAGALAKKEVEVSEVEKFLKEFNYDQGNISLSSTLNVGNLSYDNISLVEAEKILDISIMEEGLEIRNDAGLSKIVNTCNEWKKSIDEGYYPWTTYAIKMNPLFEAPYTLVKAIHNLKIPKISFIDKPKLSMADVRMLSPRLLPSLSGEEENFINQLIKDGKSLGDLVEEGTAIIKTCSQTSITFEWAGMEATCIELLRGDLNNDGIEDILVFYYNRALGGTFGAGSVMTLTRIDNKGLIEVIS